MNADDDEDDEDDDYVLPVAAEAEETPADVVVLDNPEPVHKPIRKHRRGKKFRDGQSLASCLSSIIDEDLELLDKVVFNGLDVDPANEHKEISTMIMAVHFKIKVNGSSNQAASSNAASLATFSFVFSGKSFPVQKTVFVGVSQVPQLHFAFYVESHQGADSRFTLHLASLVSVPNVQLLEAFEVRSGGVKAKQTVTLIVKEVEGSAMTAQAVLSHHSFNTITHPSDCLAKVPFATKRLLKYFLVDNKSLSEDQLDQKSHQTELEFGNLEG